MFLTKNGGVIVAWNSPNFTINYKL